MNSLTRRWSATHQAWIFGAGFALAGIAGFIPNPLIGDNGLFVTNGAHNVVHLATAALFLLFANWSERRALRFTQIFGVVYLLVGVIGFLALAGSSETMLLGMVHINQLDNFLHVGLGAAIAAGGFLARQVPAATTGVS